MTLQTVAAQFRQAACAARFMAWQTDRPELLDDEATCRRTAEAIDKGEQWAVRLAEQIIKDRS